jgi:hypothetical protein
MRKKSAKAETSYEFRKYGPIEGKIRIWVKNIMVRTQRPSHPRYEAYRRKKIVVCAAWRRDRGKAVRWVLKNLGPPPGPGFSIDRIRNSQGYKPGNLRWASPRTQARNSAVVKLTAQYARWIRLFADCGMEVPEIARVAGVDQSTIYALLRGRTWGPDENPMGDELVPFAVREPSADARS